MEAWKREFPLCWEWHQRLVGKAGGEEGVRGGEGGEDGREVETCLTPPRMDLVRFPHQCHLCLVTLVHSGRACYYERGGANITAAVLLPVEKFSERKKSRDLISNYPLVVVDEAGDMPKFIVVVGTPSWWRWW